MKFKAPKFKAPKFKAPKFKALMVPGFTGGCPAATIVPG
jgi:hypothetical protein